MFLLISVPLWFQPSLYHANCERMCLLSSRSWWPSHQLFYFSKHCCDFLLLLLLWVQITPPHTPHPPITPASDIWFSPFVAAKVFSHTPLKQGLVCSHCSPFFVTWVLLASVWPSTWWHGVLTFHTLQPPKYAHLYRLDFPQSSCKNILPLNVSRQVLFQFK